MKGFKIRFWQKAHLFTFILVNICLYTTLFFLASYTHDREVSSAETAAGAEQYYIAASFEKDYNDLIKINENADISLLMQSYCNNFGSDDLHIAFKKDSMTVLSDNRDYDPDIEINTIKHEYPRGFHFIVISSSICDGKYELVVSKKVSYLDDEYRSITKTYSFVALGVSAFLALALYFILKGLSKPLEKLRKTTELIESGDYSATAEEKGNDDFLQLAKSFNLMLAKINSQMKTLEQNAKEKETEAEQKQLLVDNMAHEIRTPLTSIHGYAEYLQKASTSEERRIDAANYIVSETERLQKISDILLDEAYIRENDVEMKSIPLCSLLEDTVKRLERKAEECSVTIETDLNDTEIFGNETLLSMLFYNLLENAIKACQNGGKVRVSCCDGTAMIEDNGKGMTPEQLSHISEPFYRTDKSRSRAEGGVGLGLYLCSRIAEKHGAEMKFESETGKGTKITVCFIPRK
ncbi:MAG: HAMP domain-containing histidine kinase [Clostridia bacterium]|nr:HAMP domain-containing histidine kinase [Clostridia bacterium]